MKRYQKSNGDLSKWEKGNISVYSQQSWSWCRLLWLFTSMTSTSLFRFLPMSCQGWFSALGLIIINDVVSPRHVKVVDKMSCWARYSHWSNSMIHVSLTSIFTSIAGVFYPTRQLCHSPMHMVLAQQLCLQRVSITPLPSGYVVHNLTNYYCHCGV